MKRLIFLLLLSFLATPLLASPGAATDIFVDTIVDEMVFDNGTCTLREAIIAANLDIPFDGCPAGGDGIGTDNIYFLETGTIELIAPLPTITESLWIRGPGPDYLSIDANGFGRVLELVSASSVRIYGLELTGGSLGIDVPSIGEGTGVFIHSGVSFTFIFDCRITDNEGETGGGIYLEEDANLRLEQVSILNNTTDGVGAGIYSESQTELVIYNSTIAENEASNRGSLDGDGGGLYVRGDIEIRRSTISGNRAEGSGGGIYFDSSGPSDVLDIQHSTVTQNRAGVDGTGGDAGGLNIVDGFGITLRNNIIAANFDDSPAPDHWRDMAIGSLNSLVNHGYNLIGENANPNVAFFFPAGNPNLLDDYVGSPAVPIVANINPLQDFGGPTMVHPVSFTSSGNTVIDNGSCGALPGLSAEEYDQAGRAGNAEIPDRIVDRPTISNADDGCDIGAVEYRAVNIPSQHDLTVLLDGPYVNVIMDTDLGDADLIPLVQPYNEEPWNYTGLEDLASISNDMVDWVLVSFSKGGPLDAGGFALSTREAYVLEDNGSIVDSDYDFAFQQLILDPGYYWVTVEHRNHLPVTSDVPLLFNRHEFSPTHDFTQNLSQAFSSGGLAMRDRGGVFSMWGGDGNGDGGVTAFDFLNIWLPANGGPAGYQDGDFNLDGSATAFDFLQVWLPSNGQASQVP